MNFSENCLNDDSFRMSHTSLPVPHPEIETNTHTKDSLMDLVSDIWENSIEDLLKPVQKKIK